MVTLGIFTRNKKRKSFRKAISDVAHPITFEMLEPRLMLSADLSLTAMAGQSLDLTLQLETGRQELQIIDNTNQSVLQSQPLAETRVVVITGADQEDKLTIDFTAPFTLPEGITFEDSCAGGDNTLKVVGKANVFNITGENEGNVNGSGVINFADIKNLIGGADTDTFKLAAAGSISGEIDGGAGGDTLWGPEADTTWNITGEDAGNIKGVAFRGIGNLLGAANNKDTFVFAPVGTINGTIDGGFSGFDAIEVQNSSYDVVAFNYTGFGSGNIDLDGAFAFSYSMMETITLISSGRAPPTAVTINIPTVVSDEFTLRGDDTINGIITIDSTNGTLVDTSFEAPSSSLIVNSGSGSDIITVEILEPGFSLFINGQAGNDTLIGPDIDSTWNITGTDSGSVAGAIFADIENLTGGTGADIFVFANGSQISGVIDGGSGTNTLDYSDCTADLAVDLYIGAVTGTGGVRNIQNVTGGAGNDSLIGDEVANSLIGGPGDDVLTGGQGGDTLDGGDGADTVTETRDADFILTDAALTIGMEDPDTLWGIEQAIITGGASQNTADASEFSGLLTFAGGEDDDTLIVGLGRNSFDGGPGDDTLTGGDWANLWEITGQDTGRLNGDVFTGVETLLGGAVADTFVILAAVALISKLINGRSGDDELKGNDGVNLWDITSENTGMLNGQAFINIEKLNGGAETDDFVFADGGSIDIVDGGGGQYDTMEVQRGIYDVVTLDYTGYGSGSVELDGAIVSIYSKMETIIITSSGRGPPTTATINVLTGVSDEFILRDEGAPDNGIITIYNTNSTFTDTTFEAPTGSLTINSGQGNDTIAIEVSEPSFDLFINGQAGNDTLIGPDTDNTWNINGSDAGTVEGIAFSSIEDLIGAADNEDTFVFTDGGSLSGIVEGGVAGFDSLVVQGTYDTIVFTPTGPDSGAVDCDGDIIIYAGLEPVNAGSAVNVIFNGTANVDNWIIEDSPTAGQIQVRSTTVSIETTSFDNPTTLIINLGDDDDILTINSFGDSGFAGTVTINGDAGDDTISIQAISTSATYQINGGAHTTADTVEATANENMTLTDTSLSVGSDKITLSNIEQAELTGGTSPNTLDASGFSGNATLIGLGGNDILKSGAGNDTLDGGLGDDSYLVTASFGADTITEQSDEGIDTLDFSGYTDTFIISIIAPQIVGGDGSTITFGDQPIENIVGGVLQLVVDDVDSFRIAGNFEMEVSGSKFAVTVTDSSTLSDPLGLFTLDTEVDASLYISADGIATSIALTGSMSGLGFSFSGAMVFEAQHRGVGDRAA
ncbi:MAG: LEPR-XLL domain-containing protein [Planctomycetota bacterium]